MKCRSCTRDAYPECTRSKQDSPDFLSLAVGREQVHQEPDDESDQRDVLHGHML